MTRLALALALLLLLPGCEQIHGLTEAARCKLYPSKCLPAPLPPEPPAVEQPAPTVAVPVEPSHAPPRAAERTAAPRKATKSRPEPKAKPKPAPRVETGPDLPYPCWLVRLHAGGKSQAQLDALARQHGVKLTPKQERQARACLSKGK
jgi:hypothetical protein